MAFDFGGKIFGNRYAGLRATARLAEHRRHQNRAALCIDHGQFCRRVVGNLKLEYNDGIGTREFAAALQKRRECLPVRAGVLKAAHRGSAGRSGSRLRRETLS